ncbi:MAG TPA: hypothetical protein VH143_29355 [Kofleriaceae bacterium]|nr:hypothetical protein [Kofleriaceae bacterium]
MLVVGTSSAAFAAPRMEVTHARVPVATRIERGHGPVVRGPIARPVGGPITRGPVVIGHTYGRPSMLRPVWRPIIRPIVIGQTMVDAPVYTDGFATVGSFDFAFDGTQTIDLGAGRTIDTLRIAGDSSTEIYSVTVTYADGETQTIACNQCGSFQADLGGNVVTNLTVNANHASALPLQIQVA